MSETLPDLIRFGRAVCGDLAQAERREWWLGNGLGAYAAGSIAGTLTRRYHGLLVAPIEPPLGRWLVFAKAEATLIAVSYTHLDVYKRQLHTRRFRPNYASNTMCSISRAPGALSLVAGYGCAEIASKLVLKPSFRSDSHERDATRFHPFRPRDLW